ncbi:hypothetical protein C5167_044490 [Papaver somniferum]|uniref:Uncharacterized protein n=1 Tax=Papaver somniferum TaxID=3469 RepID=A0A4Y7LCL9_PAPSO|nr:hypothetical protein C5167_044490 [Papaver somniferum]
MKNRDEKKDGYLNLGWADKIPVSKFKLMSIPHMQTVHEPTGVGGQIFPCNFPLLKFVRKVTVAATTNRDARIDETDKFGLRRTAPDP